MLSLAATVGVGESAATELVERLNTYQTISATFEQRLLDESGNEEQRLTGVMRLRIPNLFWWEIQSPYRMFFLLKDDLIVTYDPDLEQVTYQSVKQSPNLPLKTILMNRDYDRLNRYIVSPKRNGYVLEPVQNTELFQSISIYFDGDELDAIDIRDVQQQVTEFTFSQLKTNDVLSDDLFELNLPDDVEVLGQRPDTSTSE